jgi:predicted metal-dependent phosphoesterase TrpH
MVKVELHAHTSDDPEDAIAHSPHQLIDRAASLGYGALAITLHDRHTDGAAFASHAAARRITLIPAIERTIEGRHVLLINYPAAAVDVASFAELRRMKPAVPDGLIVAPHPWYPLGRSLGRTVVDRHADLWDAIEINAFYVRGVDFNRPARRWAHQRGVPLVGNGDVHQLEQLGTTYSLVHTGDRPTANAVCAAIRDGRVEVRSQPLPPTMAARIAIRALLSRLYGRPWG